MVKGATGVTECTPNTTATACGSLSDGIASANPGDVVFIGAGTFEETTTLVLPDDITLIGAGINITVIDLPDGANGFRTAGNTVLRDMTLFDGFACTLCDVVFSVSLGR